MSLPEFNEEEYKEYLIEEQRQKTELERKRAAEAEKRRIEAEKAFAEAEKRRIEAEKREANLEKENAKKLISALLNLNCNKETIQKEFERVYPELVDCFEEFYESK